MRSRADVAERQLVELAVRGDRVALEQLLERHEDRVTAVCASRLRSRHDVSDAVQETFLRAMTRLDQLRDHDAFGPWVRAIAVRTCADLGRSATRTAWSELDDETAAADPRPEEVVELSERQSRIRSAFGELGDRDRRMLWLRHEADAPVSVIAAELGVTEGSARVLLTRARQRLREATAGLPVLVPVPWRTWLRSRRWTPVDPSAAFASLATVAAIAAPLWAPTVHPADVPAPASAPASSHQAPAPSAPHVPAVEVEPGVPPAHVPGGPDEPATARSAEPASSTIVDIGGSARVQEGYPEDEEYLVELSSFSGDEEVGVLRLYGIPATAGDGLADLVDDGGGPDRAVDDPGPVADLLGGS